MLIDLGDGQIIDVDQQLLELDRVDMQDSLYLFLRQAWSFIDPAPWLDGWPIEAIAEHLQAVTDGEIRRLAINIPPRMGKTSVVSIAFPAWTWAQSHAAPLSGPKVSFLHASYAAPLSTIHSVKCRRLIESAWYQQRWLDRFRLTSDQNTKVRFSNDKGGERLVTSIDARVTGEGGDIFVVDDPNATNEAFSEAAIRSVVEWWDGTAVSRLNDPKTGAFIGVQQRVAEDDWTGHVLSKDVDGWTHLCLPARYEWQRHSYSSIGWNDPRGCDEDGEPLVRVDDDGSRIPVSREAARILRDEREGALLWPERFGEAELSRLEKDLGPFLAAGQLQQRPEPAGGGVIKREWWKTWEEAAYPPMDYIIGSLDTAYTIKTENDYSAMTVWGVFSSEASAQATRSMGPDGRIVFDARTYVEGAPKVMLMHAWQERLELHELVEKVADTARRLKIDKLMIENKAAGHSVAQEIRRLYNAEDFAVLLYDPKSQDKLSRLYSVQHLFAEGMIYAPDMSWAEMVITQVAGFPRGKHDDLVDTCSQALRHMRDLGLLVRAPERLSDIEAARQFTGRAPEPLYPG